MINSGLSMLRSLNILAEQTESKALAGVVNQVRIDVETRRVAVGGAGASTRRRSTASTCRWCEPARSAVRSTACCSGSPSTIEKQVELRRKVKSAMTYPVVVAHRSCCARHRDVAVRHPDVPSIYKQLGGKLPGADPDPHRHLERRMQAVVPS